MDKRTSHNATARAAVLRRAVHQARTITPDDSFPRQWEFINTDVKAICLMCSRRAGKTAGLVLRTVKRSQENRKHRTLLIHHTRMLGKQQFFEPLRDLLKEKGIVEAHHDVTELNVTLDNGSFIQVVGCDDIRDVGKKLGFYWDDIIIDETQEFNDEVLTRLVDKTILPTLIDKGGSLTLAGTPADIEAGLWYDLIVGKHSRFVQRRWTLLDNPHIDRQKIIETMSMRGFTIDFDNHANNAAIIQREIFGRQVIDPEKLVYSYEPGPEFNDWPVQGIPLVDAPLWRYSMGIDIGGVDESNDADAIVVLGWRMDDASRALYERESWTGRGDSQEFCARVLETFNRWRPQYGCADTGGAGAVKMLAYLKPRLGGLELESKPTSVDTSQRLLNDEFRSHRMKLNPLGEVVKAVRTCRKGKHEPDVMAACRYAFHGAYSWMAKAAPEKREPTSQEIDDELDRKRVSRWQENLRIASSPWKNLGGWG